MEFVQNFTPPDFRAKNFTPSISPTGCPRKNTLIKFLDQRSCSSPARRHCGQDSAAASRNGAQRRRSPQPARLLCLRAGEEHDLQSKNFIRVFFLGHPVVYIYIEFIFSFCKLSACARWVTAVRSSVVTPISWQKSGAVFALATGTLFSRVPDLGWPISGIPDLGRPISGIHSMGWPI